MREALEERVQKAILRESFFRWESAATIGFFGVLATLAGATGIVPGPFWAYLLAGVGATGAVVYSSLKNPEFSKKVVADMLKKEFTPPSLHAAELRSQVEQAQEYRAKIEEAIWQNPNQVFQDELNQTASDIDDWVEHIYDLAQQIDRYKQNVDIFRRDESQARKRIRDLEKTLSQTSDPAVRGQMEKTLDSLKRQHKTLSSLENTIQRAELQLENTLTHLATMYSQMMLVDAKDDSSRARRLRHEIEEEVVSLQDMLSAMDEVETADSFA